MQDPQEEAALSKHMIRLDIPPEQRPAARLKWAVYFGEGSLENLQELCEDLGVVGNISSRKQCNVALGRLHVNIAQFLKAMAGPSVQVIRFPNRRALINFTIKKGKMRARMFPKDDIPKGCPLRRLLKELF